MKKNRRFHNTKHDGIAQTNCALYASCFDEAFQTEYYIRDG